MSSDQELDEKANHLVEKWIERYRRGSLRFFIVHLLLHKHQHKVNDSTKPSSFHGYKLSQKIDEITKGKWRPTTASIYPILKELNEAEVLDRIPGVEQQETGRTVIEYQLTPFGLKVGKKLEDARKNFAKAFVSGNGSNIPHLLFPIGRKLSHKEVQAILTEAPEDGLLSHKHYINKRLKHIKDQLKLLENELERRQKEKNSLI